MLISIRGIAIDPKLNVIGTLRVPDINYIPRVFEINPKAQSLSFKSDSQMLIVIQKFDVLYL